MNAADTAHEAASKATDERRRQARIARENQLKGSETAALALREAWEPIRLFQQEMRRHVRYERKEPEGVVRND